MIDVEKSYNKYMSPAPLTDNEVRALHRHVSITLKRLWDLGMNEDPLFKKLDRVLKDMYHMKESRKKAGKWNPIKRSKP